MPRSGFATQFCPCGSGIRPHIAISFAARSLHVNPREKAPEQTIYVCEVCAAQFDRILATQNNLFRSLNPRIRDAMLGAISLSVVTVWEYVQTRIPK